MSDESCAPKDGNHAVRKQFKGLLAQGDGLFLYICWEFNDI